MAVYNLANYTSADGLGFPLNFRRGNPNPLDNSSVWASLSAAQTYADSDPTAYVGQVLTVVDNTNSTATVYVIADTDGTLEKVGTSPVGDEDTITVADDGTISLYGVSGLELTRTEEDGGVTNITYQPLLVNGKLTWVEPSATTVEGLATEIEGLKNRVTTTETGITGINAKLGTIPSDKTVVQLIDESKTAAIETVLGEAVPEDFDTLKEVAEWIQSDTTNSAALITRVSDIEEDYLTSTDKNTLQGDIDTIEAYIGTIPEAATSENVISYIGEAIDALSIDDYAKTTALTALADRVDDLEAVDAEKNIINSVDTTQFSVDDSRKLSLTAVAMDKVAGLNDALSGKVDKVTGSRLITADEATKLENLVLGEDGTVEISGQINASNVQELGSWITTNRDTIDGLLSAAEETKLNGIEAGAQVNDIETVKVNGTTLSITEKAVDIPLGAGLTASTEVTIGDNGALGIGSIGVSKLVNDGTTLILNGGASAL